MANFFKGVINGMIRNYNIGIQNYTEAIREQPNLILAYLNRADLLVEMADHQFLEQYYSSSVTITWGEQEIPPEQGLPKTPDYSLALADLNYVIEKQPDFAFAYFNRGNLRNKTRDYYGAILDYTAAIGNQEKFAEAYFNRGLTYLLLNETSKACTDLSQAGEMGLVQAYRIINKYCKP
jgi:tetratricopeptide (TPR) repeat protein